MEWWKRVQLLRAKEAGHYAPGERLEEPNAPGEAIGLAIAKAVYRHQLSTCLHREPHNSKTV